jgi:hypothetical protein
MKNGTQQTVWSEAPRPLRTHERIDQQLRDLLVRCMAIDFNDIPSLQSVSDETKEAVASKGPDGNPRETDEYILRYVQAFIHEPNV